MLLYRKVLLQAKLYIETQNHDDERMNARINLDH